MQPRFKLGNTVHVVEPVRGGGDILLEIDGHLVNVQHDRLDNHHGRVIVNGVEHAFFVAQDGKNLFVHMDGRCWSVETLDEFSGTDVERDAGSGQVRAPMPGVLLELHVCEGEEVDQGQYLFLMESMKLQTEVRASVAGMVRRIYVEEGASFDKGAVLMEVTPTPDQSS